MSKSTLHAHVMASLNRNGITDATGAFYSVYAGDVVSHVLRMARRELPSKPKLIDILSRAGEYVDRFSDLTGQPPKGDCAEVLREIAVTLKKLRGA